MNRMKFIITALLCAVSSCLYGQPYKKYDKLEKPWMEYNKVLINKLKCDLDLLQRELDSLRYMRGQRDSLLNAVPAPSHPKSNASPRETKPYASVAELAQRKDWAENDSLKPVYEVLARMYESVNDNGKYVPKDNEQFKKSIPELRKKLQAQKSPLLESFNDLANQIVVFKDAVDELEKVKKLVDKMNYESQQQYIEALDNDFEIEFVKAVPYTLKQLNGYIEEKMKRDKNNADQKKRAQDELEKRKKGIGGDGKTADGTPIESSRKDKMQDNSSSTDE